MKRILFAIFTLALVMLIAACAPAPTATVAPTVLPTLVVPLPPPVYWWQWKATFQIENPSECPTCPSRIKLTSASHAGISANPPSDPGCPSVIFRGVASYALVKETCKVLTSPKLLTGADAVPTPVWEEIP